MPPEIRTRFAPSPTGMLHLGGARTALFNYVFARKSGGKFVLRIEDTDVSRSSAEYEEDITQNLRWLGIEWDEFYRQSERKEIYHSFLKKLLDDDVAYVSREETGESREVIRFRNPGRKVLFEDLIRGEISFDTSELGDFVIAKDESSPLFHFAVVVDDHEMNISHVIRGEEHISNTPRQILIQEALGFSRPKYAHLPLLLGPDRSKLSKRHGASSIREYRELGYVPEALVNFLALLGWHPRDNRELFSKEELIKIFSLERVQKSGAVFDSEKLNWLNREYIKRISPEELLGRLQNFIPLPWRESGLDLAKIALLSRERMTVLSDFVELNRFFFELPPYEKELLRWQGRNVPGEHFSEAKRRWGEASSQVRSHLKTLAVLLSQMSEKDFSKNVLEKNIMPYAEKEGRGETLWPLRVALSGALTSPGPFEIMDVLGKEESIRRIEGAREKLENA